MMKFIFRGIYSHLPSHAASAAGERENLQSFQKGNGI